MPSKRRFSPPLRPPTPGTTRVASIGALPRVLAQFGYPLDALLREAGQPPTLFDDLDAFIEVGASVRLVELAAERTACPHLGLLCGAQHVPKTIGITGRLAENARDIGSALRGLCLNLHLNGHVFVATLTVSGDIAEFGLRLALDLPDPSRVAVDLGFSGAFAIVRAICGPDWKPLDILLVHEPVGSSRPYTRFFGLPVRFGSPRNAIVFDRSWLDRKVHGASAGKLALLERELAVIAQQDPLPLPVATRRILLTCMARGDLSMRAASAGLGLHPRTLNRHLAEIGTSVFELIKDVRYQVARELLAHTALPVTEVAATLGYSTINSFTRAFRQWSDHGPREWRARHRAPRR